MSFFTDLAKGERPSCRAWVPFLEELAAAVEGCDLEDLTGDPTRWSNALPKAARLVGSEVVAVGFIPALCVAAFAANPVQPWCEGVLATLLECVRRLAETVRPERELVVALSGPATLCRLALGSSTERSALDALKPGLVKTLEMVCAARPDMIVLDEQLVAEPLTASADLRRFCNTLKNVTEYYGVSLGLRVSGHVDSSAVIEELRSLRIDHLLLGPLASGALPGTEVIVSAAAAGWSSLGLPLAGALPDGIAETAGMALYFCSVQQERDVDALRQLGGKLSR